MSTTLHHEVKQKIRDLSHAVQLEGIVREEMVNLEAVNAARAGQDAVRAALVEGERCIAGLVGDVSRLKSLCETLSHPFPLGLRCGEDYPSLFPALLPPDVCRMVHAFLDMPAVYATRTLSRQWYLAGQECFAVPRYTTEADETISDFEDQLHRTTCDDQQAELLQRVVAKVKQMRNDVAPLVLDLRRMRQAPSQQQGAADRSSVKEVRAVVLARTQLVYRRRMLRYRLRRLKEFLNVPMPAAGQRAETGHEQLMPNYPVVDELTLPSTAAQAETNEPTTACQACAS